MSGIAATQVMAIAVVSIAVGVTVVAFTLGQYLTWRRPYRYATVSRTRTTWPGGRPAPDGSEVADEN